MSPRTPNCLGSTVLLLGRRSARAVLAASAKSAAASSPSVQRSRRIRDASSLGGVGLSSFRGTTFLVYHTKVTRRQRESGRDVRFLPLLRSAAARRVERIVLVSEGVDMTPGARQRLLDLFRTRAVAFGRFTLASGKESTYYINSKKALFHSEAVALLGEALWELTKDLNIQAIGGPEVGAIPMATAAVLRYHQEGRELEGFFVRKQAKGHGSQELIE